MRRSFSVLIVAVVGAALLSTPALATRRAPQRIVDAPYRTPVIGASIGGQNQAYFFDCLTQLGCTIIPLKRGDRYAQLEIKDATGQAVMGSVYTMPGSHHFGYFCGATDDPINLSGASEILVHVLSGACPSGAPSIATTGIVQAKITRR